VRDLLKRQLQLLDAMKSDDLSDLSLYVLLHVTQEDSALILCVYLLKDQGRLNVARFS